MFASSPASPPVLSAVVTVIIVINKSEHGGSLFLLCILLNTFKAGRRFSCPRSFHGPQTSLVPFPVHSGRVCESSGPRPFPVPCPRY